MTPMASFKHQETISQLLSELSRILTKQIYAYPQN